MYDGIHPVKLPHDGQIYASYTDGRWPNFDQLKGLFPGKIYVSIAVDPAHDAEILDVERFDATPADSVDWVLRQRKRGADPTVYCNTATIPQVMTAFAARKVPSPHLWEANYDGRAVLNPGTVAKQYQNTPGYDKSVVADYWPGIDPKPAPPKVEVLNMDEATLRAIIHEEIAKVVQQEGVSVTGLLDWAHKGHESIEAFLSGIPGYVALAHRK
jgi:hypothetical protein